MKSFTYLGYTFTPLKKFNNAFDEARYLIEDNEYTPKDYNYEDFYKAANKAGAGQIDLFLYNGYEVMPCGGWLAFYKKSPSISGIK